MPEQFQHFVDFPSLEVQSRSTVPFHLVYLLGTNQDKHLKRLSTVCALAPAIMGVVFVIQEDKQDYDDLFFLKIIAENILNAGKRVGFWGVPACVPRKILGSYLYMKFRRIAITQNQAEATSTQAEYRVEACGRCIDKEGCAGLGKKNSQHYKPFTKSLPPAQLSGVDITSAEFSNKLLDNTHKVFVEHCYTIRSHVADRRVYYATNIDYQSDHSYKNRFIYQCDYLPPEEYRYEYEFLKNHAINKPWALRLEALSSVDKTRQIAYSLAEKNGQMRESFYMFVSEKYGPNILDDLNIAFTIPETQDMAFIGTGIDIIEENVACYKLYFKSPKSFVATYFDMDIMGLSHNSHYVVLRLDKESELISFKIELLFEYQDLSILKPLLKDYSYFQEQLEPAGLYNIAIEFEQNSISKINVYHRKQLAT